VGLYELQVQLKFRALTFRPEERNNGKIYKGRREEIRNPSRKKEKSDAEGNI
jgi:hypothetical protein